MEVGVERHAGRSLSYMTKQKVASIAVFPLGAWSDMIAARDNVIDDGAKR
jgi:hypothetical protein